MPTATRTLRLPPGSVWLLGVIYLGFISIGLPDGAFGVAWPRIRLALHLPIELAGSLTIGVTILGACSSLGSGPILRRWGTGPVVLVSGVLTASALVLISRVESLTGLIVAAIPLGLGAGAVDAGLNGYVARHYSGRHMNWLHACWGIGATVGPLLMTRALTTETTWRGGYQMLAGIQGILALLFLVTLRLWQSPEGRQERARPAMGSALSVPFGQATANSFAGWLATGSFILYSVAEATTGLWSNSVLVVSRGLPESVAGLCVSAFYASITGGRIAAGFVTDRWGNRRVIQAGLMLAAAGAGLFLVASSGPVAFAALSLIGLGLAPVYPGLMHEAPRRFTVHDTPIIIGRQTGAAYVGAALIPAVVGGLTRLTSPECAGWVMLTGGLVLLGVVRKLDRVTRPQVTSAVVSR